MNDIDAYMFLQDVHTLCGKSRCKYSRKEFKTLLRENGVLEDGESVMTRTLKEIHKEDSSYTYQVTKNGA
jgi:hypothetical protein